MSAFQKPVAYRDLADVNTQPRTMTLQGTVNATAILLGACATSALLTVMLVPSQFIGLVSFGGAILGFILAMVIAFKPRLAPSMGLVYAVLEGAFLGGISLFYENWAGAQVAATEGTSVVGKIGDSIVLQAVLLTFGIAGAMLLAYSLRVIRATPMFMRVIMIMTIGYVFAALGTMLLRFFVPGIPYLHEMGMMGIGIAGFVVVLAALNLILDFKIIEDGVKTGQPRFMEWYGAFALMVTLVWLYLRVLYLLAMLRRSD